MRQLLKIIFLGILPGALMAAGTHEHSHGHHEFSVGEPGEGKPDRRIDVAMLDTMRFRFSPELSRLEHGETIEFIVHNDGQIRHEFSIGNAEDQVKHAEMMRKMPDMKHQDPNTVALGPG